MRKISKLLVASGLVAAMGLSFTACGGEPVPEGFTSIKYYASYVSTYTKSAFEEMVKTYNETQGQTDKVVVTMQPSTSVLSYNNIIGKKGKSFDVVSVSNASGQFKNVVTRGDHFVHLEQYLNDAAKETLAWDQIPESSKNIWRFNSTLENGKYRAGEGADLVAMPFGNIPQVLFYNTEIFAQMGVNVVSVNEELCGAGEYAKLMPHGYAEYVEAPVSGLNKSTNGAGEEVYKVFNNRIPMNWEEQRILARDFQTFKGSDQVYGYMSEWWFNYLWAIGGDCIGWQSDESVYKMILNDKTDNYLALETIEVNGTTYTQGEALDYEDKTWLRANWSAEDREGKVTELPSTYEAFLEFNRLGVPKTKYVEDGIAGYGVAPPTTENRSTRFTSGESPMLNDYYNNTNAFADSAIGGKYDIAPLCNYREYVGGSTYQKNNAAGFANEYLKVIGKTYGDEVYTGRIKTVTSASGKEVPVMGEATTCISPETSGLAIPKNADPEKYEAAFKFISWACGPEGQRIVAKGNMVVPNQTNVGLSDEFSDSDDRVCKNAYAAAYANRNSYVGDWSYFNVETWIAGWATPLNYDVREGKLKLSKYFDDYFKVANVALAPMSIYMKRS